MLKQRKFRKGKKVLSSDEEIDPMIYSVNMVDCMLVLAVGFLIFTIIYMENPHQDQTIIKIGKQFNTTTATTTSVGTSTGYSTVGTVYKDPTTGKLILVQNNGSS